MEMVHRKLVAAEELRSGDTIWSSPSFKIGTVESIQVEMGQAVVTLQNGRKSGPYPAGALFSISAEDWTEEREKEALKNKGGQ